MIICLQAGGSCISVFVAKPRAPSSLFTRSVSLLGKKTTRFVSERARSGFPPPHPPTPFVSALLGSLVTAEWSPHYCEELACNFHHSISFQCRANNKRQHRTPPRTCMGLLEQEGNVRGQIKSGVGLSAAWVTAPSGPEPPSPPP